MTKVKLMSQAEYAKHRGVSAVAVHKAVKGRRISLVGDKIDPVVADIQWAANTRPRIDHAKREAEDLQSPLAAVSPAAAASHVIVARQVDAPAAPEDYWASRARREAAEAAIAEMKRDELEGHLIRADAIRAAWARRIATARDALLQIPARLAPLLAAEPSMERVAELLEVELRQALADLSGATGEAT